MNPFRLFEAPVSYNELLSKLSVVTFIVTLAYVIFLTASGLVAPFHIKLTPDMEEFVSKYPWLKLASSYGVTPLISAVFAFFLSKFFELHNLLSKLFLVRYLWDKYYIVKPLAEKANYHGVINKQLVRRVMRSFFYKNLENIDEHYVRLFWNSAYYFWILFEHFFVVFVSLLYFVFFTDNIPYKLIVYNMVVFLITLIQFFLVTGPKSKSEADAIPAERVENYFTTL